jgi:hypothetical protein
MHDHSVEDLNLTISPGWKEVDLVSLVSSSDQRLDQNVLRNQLYGAEMMVSGIKKCTHTRLKNILAVASIVMLFL